MPVATPGDTSVTSLEVTMNRIHEFADVVGDRNPIHLDSEYAGRTMFGGRIAHGMISAGVISAALADLPGDIVYLSQDLSFVNPVEPGDTVTATAEVTDVLGGDRIAVKTTAKTERHTVLTGTAVVLSIPHESPVEATASVSESEQSG